jgi:hypothetical protein
MEIKNEYLENLIRKKLFKDFDKWDKDDFHFLISLLNYPNYCALGLIILTNLKNWIQYSSGHFFYTIEHLEKILNKFSFNYDIYDDIINKNNNINNNNLKRENIKINIQKKENKKENKSLFNDINLFNNEYEDNIFEINDWLSIDIFSFTFWIILFIIYLIIHLFTIKDKSLKESNVNDYYFNLENELFKHTFNPKKYENETNKIPLQMDFNLENINFPKNKIELFTQIFKLIYKYIF